MSPVRTGRMGARSLSEQTFSGQDVLTLATYKPIYLPGRVQDSTESTYPHIKYVLLEYVHFIHSVCSNIYCINTTKYTLSLFNFYYYGCIYLHYAICLYLYPTLYKNEYSIIVGNLCIFRLRCKYTVTMSVHPFRIKFIEIYILYCSMLYYSSIALQLIHFLQ